MKVMISGSTGFIGSELLKFVQNSLELIAVGVFRNENKAVENHECDMRFCDFSVSSIKKLKLDDIDVLVHSAGKAHVFNDKDNYEKFEIYDVNVKATIALARHAARNGVKHFIFISSVKVLGECTARGAPFSNASLPAPIGDYAISKYLAEVLLKEICLTNNMHFTVIRPPLVYGANPKGNLLSLSKLLNTRFPLPFGSLNSNKRSLIRIDNLISFITLCFLNPNAYGQTFLVSDDNDLSTLDIVNLLQKNAETKSIIFKFPARLLAFMLSLTIGKARSGPIFENLQIDVESTKCKMNWKPSP